MAKITSKMFKLKHWFNLFEAAEHLSVLLEGDLKEADVLRLGLNLQLKLSVDFVNGTYARHGKIVSREEVDWHLQEELPETDTKIIRIDPNRLLSLENKATEISGIWDLLMIKGARKDIENRYQMLTGGPEIVRNYQEGIFVESGKQTCQLNEINEEAMPQLEYLTDFYPANELPHDCVLVVRKGSILELQESHLSESNDIQPEVPFFNTSHPFYAKELKIAIEAWTELYQKNPPQHVPLRGHKGYIVKWLEKNHPELGQRAKDRISTIINPNPKGGASPTS